MAATLIGTVGLWGIASDETGLIIHKLDDVSRNEKNFLKDKAGCRIGRSDYDESMEIEIEGKLTATSPWSQKTKELILAWDDEGWHTRNPEHPFAYLKVAFQNFERLTDYCRKGTPIAFVTKGSKIAFLSLNASDQLQEKVFKELNRK